MATPSRGKARGRKGQFIRTVESAERDAQAARLRSQGYGLREIADELGWADASAASRAVSRALAAVPAEAVAELRRLEGQRLDDLLFRLKGAVEAGDVKAITEARKISESRRRLLALDGAVKVEMTAPGGELAVALAEAKARLAAERQEADGDEG